MELPEDVIPLTGSLTTDEKKMKWLYGHVAWLVVPEVVLWSFLQRTDKSAGKKSFLFLNPMLWLPMFTLLLLLYDAMPVIHTICPVK